MYKTSMNKTAVSFDELHDGRYHVSNAIKDVVQSCLAHVRRRGHHLGSIVHMSLLGHKSRRNEPPMEVSVCMSRR